MAAESICKQGGFVGLLTFSRGGGIGAVVQNRESPDFRYPEVGISEKGKGKHLPQP